MAKFDSTVLRIGSPFDRYQRCKTAVICVIVGLTTPLWLYSAVFTLWVPEYDCAEFTGDLLDFNDSVSPCYRTNTTWCTDFMYANLSRPFVSLAQDFDLVCDRKPILTLAVQLQIAAYAIGIVVLGWMSDRFGRTKMVKYTLPVGLIAGLIAAFSTHPAMYIAFRCIVCAVGASGWLFGILLGTEIVGGRYRAFAVGLVHITWAIGTSVTAILAFFSVNWKYFTIATVLPGLPAIPLILFYVDESPRWHMVRANTVSFRRLMREISDANRTYKNEGHLLDLLAPHQSQMVTRYRTSWKEFRTVLLLKLAIIGIVMGTNSVAGSAIWILVNFSWIVLYTVAYPGFLYFWFTTDGLLLAITNLRGLTSPIFPTVAAFLLIDCLAAGGAVYFADRIGRILPVIVLNVAGGSILFVLAAASIESSIVWVVVGAIARYALTSSTVVLTLLTVETAPTTFRGISLAIPHSIASVFFLIGTVIQQHALPSTLAGGLAVMLASALILLVPDTWRKLLPDWPSDDQFRPGLTVAKSNLTLRACNAAADDDEQEQEQEIQLVHDVEDDEQEQEQKIQLDHAADSDEQEKQQKIQLVNDANNDAKEQEQQQKIQLVHDAD